MKKLSWWCRLGFHFRDKVETDRFNLYCTCRCGHEWIDSVW